MNVILEQVNSMGKTFVEFAGPMLVQSSVLIIILLLLDLLLRKKVRAVFRYCIWMLVLVKLILPSTLSSPASLGYWFGDELAGVKSGNIIAALNPVIEPALQSVKPALSPPSAAEAESVMAESAAEPPALTAPVSWQGVVFLVWLVVVAAMGLLLLQRAVFVCGLVAQAKEASGLMTDALDFCCRKLGIEGKVKLKVSANATSPAVCGLFRPVILVPENLASSLGVGQLRTVLLHELVHIKRGDLWTNLFQTLLQILYFYNPFVWLANAIIRRVREQAVDEAVQVAMGEKAEQYPETLLNVAKLAFKRPALSLRLLGVVESKSALKGRIERMLNRPIPKSAKLGVVGVLAVLIIGAILLPMARAEKETIDYGQKSDVQVEVEGTKQINTAELADLQLNPAPWVDGEVMRLNLNTMVGMEIGTIIYTAESVIATGRKAWRVESYMVVPLNNTQQFTSVDAELDSFTPITGKTKNQMGDFIAEYKPDKVQLTVAAGEKKTTREIKLDNVAYDNEQAIYLIRRLPLKEDYKASFPIFPVQSGAVVDCVIEVTGKKKIAVPAGTFDCYAVDLAVYSGTVKALEHKLWFSADKHRYLVKYDSGQAIMELAEIALKQKDKPKIIRDEELNISITIPADWHCYKSKSAGMYRFSLRLLPTELKAWSVITATELALPGDIGAREIAEKDVEVLKGFFKNYTVRPDSWRQPEISKIPAAQYIADYVDKEGAMVEYRTYLLGESMVYWFVFRIEEDKFEAAKSEFDSIVNSFELKL